MKFTVFILVLVVCAVLSTAAHIEAATPATGGMGRLQNMTRQFQQEAAGNFGGFIGGR